MASRTQSSPCAELYMLWQSRLMLLGVLGGGRGPAAARELLLQQATVPVSFGTAS